MNQSPRRPHESSHKNVEGGLSSAELIVVTAVILTLGFVVAFRSYERHQRVQRQEEAQRQFLADARIAVRALDSLASAVQVGVLYPDYAKRVADTNAAVEPFLRKWPEDLAPLLRANVEGAMNDFALALEAWAQRIKGGEWISQRHEMAPRLLAVTGVRTRYESGSMQEVIYLEPAQQEVWARALQEVKEARAIVGP